MKTCSKCSVIQPLENFAKDSRGRDGRRASCKSCHTEWMKAYNLANAELNREKQKARDAARPKGQRHNITEEQYQQLVSKHNGLCWACKNREGNVIDHDHSCCSSTYSCGSCVRGILCRQCNTALGLLGESDIMVKGLLSYISPG